MTLCELCTKKKCVYKITIQKIMRNNNGEQSQHVPYGQSRTFGICEDCLPFSVVTETVQVVEVKQIKRIEGKI